MQVQAVSEEKSRGHKIEFNPAESGFACWLLHLLGHTHFA